jgi:hypothetical protein
MNRRDLLLCTAGLILGCDNNMAQQFSASGQLTNIISGYDGTIKVGTNGNLINGHGTVVQLRGHNLLEWAGGMLFGIPFNNTLSPSGVPDASGGSNVSNSNGTDNSGSVGAASATVTAIGPNLTHLDPWKPNIGRLGYNDCTMLSLTGYLTNGTAVNPNNTNPSGTNYPKLNFLNQMAKQIQFMNQHGMYAVVVCAWTNPGLSLSAGQDGMATQDHSITGWQTMCNAFGFPNGTFLKRNGGIVDDRSVIFELFNEPTLPEAIVYNGGFYNGPSFVQGVLGSTSYAQYGIPVNTPTGTFTPGEAFTASNGTAGTIMSYYLNTTTGYQSSGTKFLYCINMSGTNISGGVPTTSVPMPSGTTITGTSSGATATVQSSAYSGQASAGEYGWYAAGHIQLLQAIRAAGAGNVCLCSGNNFAGFMPNWLTYMAGQDNTAPAGWSNISYGNWTSQLGATWHPYPDVSTIHSVSSVANSGSGYAVNDTVLLLMDETGGPNTGTVYWQTQLKVTSIGAGGSITGVSINGTYAGGIPGVPGGNSTQYNLGQFGGGIWSTIYTPAVVPVDTVGAQPGTSGTGASFNVTYTHIGTGGGKNITDQPTLVNIKTSGYPVVMTETGEHTGSSVIVGSPYMKELTNWADTNGISMLPFALVENGSFGFSSGGCDFYINIAGTTGSPPYITPSPGYGQFMFQWFSSHAA